MRGSTLDLVLTLDLRNLRPDAASQLASMSSTPNLIDSVGQVLNAFPNLRCLLIDRQADTRRDQPASRSIRPFHHLTLLSMAHAVVWMPLNTFWRGALQGLVYLDMSYSPVKALLPDPRFLSTYELPHLRILKLAGIDVDIDTMVTLLRRFGHQLWSIDLSFNTLRDALIDSLTSFFRQARHNLPSLRSDQFFSVEGTLSPVVGCLINESSFSADFNHPDRYLADPPVYTAENGIDPGLPSQHQRRARLRGIEPICGDSANDMITVLASGPDGRISSLPETGDRISAAGPITHLHLNGLRVRSKRVELLLVTAGGLLEHFECDRAKYFPPLDERDAKPIRWPVSLVLYGFPGAAYIFRPVFQSNLRVLKIHHSLVTNVPTISTYPLRVLENIWRSEIVFYKYNELAYPQLFSPDMNPRLYSLTLSHVPRRSTGVVIDKLVHFLKLAAAQEQNIERTRAAAPRRGPQVLHGLRHIRLEFDPDNRDEVESFDSGEDVSKAMEAFASFSESAWDSQVSQPPRNSIEGSIDSSTSDPPSSRPSTQGAIAPFEERLRGGPYVDGTDEEYRTAQSYNPLTDEMSLVHIWVGSGVVSSDNPPAVNAYMRILAADEQQNFMQDFAEATPSHIAAGVPTNSWIYIKAWQQILFPSPEDLARKPTIADLRGMKDVLEEIKSFRAETRKKYHAELDKGRGNDTANHEYWKGRLEIDFPYGRTGSVGYWG